MIARRERSFQEPLSITVSKLKSGEACRSVQFGPLLFRIGREKLALHREHVDLKEVFRKANSANPDLETNARAEALVDVRFGNVIPQ